MPGADGPAPVPLSGGIGQLDSPCHERGGLRFSLIGAQALSIEPLQPFSLPLQRRILALSASARDWPELAEPVPGVGNLMLVFADPRQLDLWELIDRIAGCWPDLTQLPPSERLIEVPVVYGGDTAIDMTEVCRVTGFAPDEVARLHSAPEYMVATVASAPGFGYLMGMDPRLAVPRKTVPALDMPKGAVTIGGAQTGISVSRGPNGWNAIGETAISMFDPTLDQPSLLQPGDRLRFVIEDICP